MIAESDIVTLVKLHIKNLIEKSEQHDNEQFISVPKDNFHLDNVLFSEINKSIPAQYAAYLEHYGFFCSLSGCAPNDSDFFNSSALTESLHKKYQYILDNCQLHDDVLTATEKAALNEAKDFLYEDEIMPSAAYQKYIQLKEELFALKDQLFADQMTARSMSQEDRTQWEATGKRLLEEKIKLVERKLVIEGQQERVEAAVRVYEKMRQKNPAIIWDALIQRISELHQVTGTGLVASPYLPIQPSPPFDSINIWQQATISQRDIQRLIRQSKTTNMPLNTISDLVQIDFNWSSVYLTRDWFESTFFKSHYWTMPNKEVVSEGRRPNTGILPAYVKRLIFTKAISFRVQTKQTTKPTSSLPSRRPIRLGRPFKLHPFNRITGIQRTDNLRTRHLTAANLGRFKMATPIKTMPIATQPLKVQKLAINKRPYQLLPMSRLTTTQRKTFAAAALKTNKRPLIKKNDKNLRLYLDKRRFTLVKPSSKKKIKTSNIAIEDPLVLAFECKRVPLCPNPE